ncbi:hypothetical protein V6N12_015746 [Hibiscus sabdariffa]|uniref:PHD finger protein ALFIN-LIKE n=1 Tax=Hibiscus sabdariffa TaxID=183260 RepID=A0ABR2DP30_9ROSI
MLQFPPLNNMHGKIFQMNAYIPKVPCSHVDISLDISASKHAIYIFFYLAQLFQMNGQGHRASESTKYSNSAQPKDEDEGLDEEHGDTLCGACGENYAVNEFWICCDICKTWFHGKCVKITPARAEHIKQYKCPSCSNKKGRP